MVPIRVIQLNFHSDISVSAGCEDPEVDDYGSKWSFSALLRHLKKIGVDTQG